jgi:hypothetical protein
LQAREKVSGWVYGSCRKCSKGVGKLIFLIRKVNTFSYHQVIDYFREDIEKYGENLYFQQDGEASCFGFFYGENRSNL